MVSMKPVPTPVLTLTPTNIADLRCHKRYETLRVKKLWPGTKERSPALRYNNVCHDVLRRVYDPRNGAPTLDSLDDHIRAAFRYAPYSDPDERAHDMGRCRKIVTTYFDQDEDREPGWTKAVEIEGIFPVKAGDLVWEVWGKLDRIIVRPWQPEVLTVRDYTLGRKVLSELQAWCDLVVAKRLYPGYSLYVLELDCISDEEIERIIWKSSEMKGLVKQVEEMVRGYITAEEKQAMPGEVCSFCPLRRECRSEVIIDVQELEF